MRIAFVHYHARPGGVTRVIEHSISALIKQGHRVVLLTGSPPTTPIPSLPIADLNYQDPPTLRAEPLLDQLKQAAAAVLGDTPDVWHVHNHSMGKNISLTAAVYLLAKQNQKLLLQIHDFPEDGRPTNYQRLLRWGGDSNSLGKRLYPQADHVHYAVLNGRDRQFLLEAGARPAGVHLLPNPVFLPDPIPRPPPTENGERMFLYPTRAIRRKNAGEFLLWAALCRPGERFVLTLAPTSPEDRPGYERWINLAKSLKLPVEFEAGLRGNTLTEMFRQCHAVLTTSIAEGFGLAFLEPWLAGKMLLGRDLPEITSDFRSQGMALSHLYARVLVPLKWIGRSSFESSIRAGLTRWRNAYQRELRPADIARALSAATENDRVDFARLDERQQEHIIRTVHLSPEARREMRQPSLSRPENSEVTIKQNRLLVESRYNLEQYGKRLDALYQQVFQSDAGPLGEISAGKLLDIFLAPERFYLLRS